MVRLGDHIQGQQDWHVLHVADAIAEVLLAWAAETPGNQPFEEFDSVAVPPISLNDYAKRIFQHFECSHEAAITTLPITSPTITLMCY